MSSKPCMSILVGRSALKCDKWRENTSPTFNLSGSEGLSLVQSRKSTSFSTSDIPFKRLKIVKKK